MIEKIFSDEVKILSKYIDKCLTFYGKDTYNTFYIVCDNNPIATYLAPALMQNLENGSVIVVEDFENASINKEYCDTNTPGIVYVSSDSFKNLKATDNSAYILLNDSNTANDKWFEILDICEDKVKNTQNCKIMVGTILPKLREIPDDIQQFAEREYSYFIEKVIADKTQAEKFYIKLEKKCRNIANNGFSCINLLRFDNLLDSTCANTANFDFEKIVAEAFNSGKIEINKPDFCKKYTFTHTKDAACALIKALFSAREGHVYNTTMHTVTLADLKTKIHNGFADKLSISTNTEPISQNEIKSFCLSNLKATKTNLFPKKFVFSKEEALYRVICNAADIDYDVKTKLGCYQGKLQRLKDIEIDILAEIDRICKKHDIKWFLAGGSLLGAIREGKSIEWDDDLDIGFLREDFEKFKKVAPTELGKKYYYSSPWTDDNCHYYIDKIRLKDSYFSTAYSNHFELEDGVFVDLIVYDQTSNNRLLEKFQINFICAMVRLLYIRWYNTPRKNYRYRLTKIILPFLRLIPWKVLHKLFDIAATMFSKKKNAQYLIDSTGQHIRYGRFPKYYLEELTEAELDGLKCPIPVHYPEYLSFFYGENYFPKPSISSQVGAHQFARLDLGEFIFEDKQPGDFRAVNIKGELFETEID